MQWSVVCWTLVVVIMAQSSSSSRCPEDKRIVKSDEPDGHDTATLYAVDTATNAETRQTKRDIEAFSSDTSSDARTFTLQLTSGQRLRMSLERRAIDTSGASFTAVTEEGEREITVEERDCFFSGAAEGEAGEGFASVSMCGGELMGSISTGRRDYDIRSLQQSGQRRDADDVMDVMVTWTDRQTRGDDDDGGLDDDVLIIPGKRGSQLTGKRSPSDRKATIEIADYVDKWFIEDVGNNLRITTDKQIIGLLLTKWSAVAHKLSNPKEIGWDLTLRLVKVVIMRENPSYYPAEPNEKIGERMTHLCKGLKDNPKVMYDHVTLHTGQTCDVNRMGLAWLGGMCLHRWRCNAMRSSSTNFRTELHEFGHSMGLNHDGRMDECVNEKNQTNGFMGGNKEHIRPCYKTVLSKTLPEKDCIFTNTYSQYEHQFN